MMMTLNLNDDDDDDDDDDDGGGGGWTTVVAVAAINAVMRINVYNNKNDTAVQ